MKKISIIDYGCGNILNLARAIKHLGFEVDITKDKEKIINSSNLILPGVGAFGYAMKQLNKYKLENTIKDYVKLNKPLLGICLGMQLLLTKSHEFGLNEGLNLIKGEVLKISNKKNQAIKIPHMGWNEIFPAQNNSEFKNKILSKKQIGQSFYFVHSFFCLTKDPKSTIANCEYFDISIPAVITSGNIYGFQFHPEKSGKNGLMVLKNFCDL